MNFPAEKKRQPPVDGDPFFSITTLPAESPQLPRRTETRYRSTCSSIGRYPLVELNICLLGVVTGNVQKLRKKRGTGVTKWVYRPKGMLVRVRFIHLLQRYRSRNIQVSTPAPEYGCCTSTQRITYDRPLSTRRPHLQSARAGAHIHRLFYSRKRFTYFCTNRIAAAYRQDVIVNGNLPATQTDIACLCQARTRTPLT